MFARIVVVACLTLVAGDVLAGQLTEGSKVRVKIAGNLAHDGSVIPGQQSQSIVGRFLSMEPDHLILATENWPDRIRVPKAAVRDVEVRSRSRLKGALIGTAIGGGVGVVWGSVARSTCRSDPDRFLCDLDLLVPVVIAVPTGTVVGLAIGLPQWSSVSPSSFERAAAPVRGGLQLGGTLKF